jgi:ABC-type multidrug transport system fused ATPase/permease subunit
MVVISAGRVAQPAILREMIDKAVPNGDTGLLLRLALLYLAIIVALGSLGYAGNMLVARLGLSVVTRVKEDIFNHLLALPVSWFDSHPVGEMMSRTESDTEKLRQLFSTLGVSLFVNILMILGIFAVTFSLAPALALVMALVIAGFLAILLVFFRRLFELYESSRGLYAKIVALVTEFVQGMEILKVFGRTGWAEKKLDEAGRRKRDTDARVSIFEYSAMSALDSLAGPLFIVALILLYAPDVAEGNMSLGTLLLFFEYGAMLLRPVVEIAESVRQMQQAKISYSRIRALMAISPEPGHEIAQPAVFAREIKFDHVWFAYRGEEWVIEDLCFSVPAGSVTAVVGASGSGKSTTVGLLCGFYRPARGQILIDGRPLDEISLDSWRRKTGLVMQDVYLFPGSVLENVRIYDETLGRSAVEKALGEVHALDFAESLPEGIDTGLWERGNNISAGEKQLLAFARALAADPELVILDEATSNVDMATEEKIRTSLSALLKGRTAFIVAHRLSSVTGADQILYFEKGRIVARGRHEELYEAHAGYRATVDRQFAATEDAR